MLPGLCGAAVGACSQARRYRDHGQSWQHKGRAVRQAIQKAEARLRFLPSYSPDLNPIEQAFAKIKHWMRTAQKRTIEDACAYIGSLVETIDQVECKNYFENDGYVSVKT